jgi:hypothetical protein
MATQAITKRAEKIFTFYLQTAIEQRLTAGRKKRSVSQAA